MPSLLPVPNSEHGVFTEKPVRRRNWLVRLFVCPHPYSSWTDFNRIQRTAWESFTGRVCADCGEILIEEKVSPK